MFMLALAIEGTWSFYNSVSEVEERGAQSNAGQFVTRTFYQDAQIMFCLHP